MATAGEPPKKKRKLNKVVPLAHAHLYEQPKRHSVLGLYIPELIIIIVTDETASGSGKRTFKVPKALLCNRSEYFDKLFSADSKYDDSGRADLQDVSRLTFGVFLGWLYCHSIFSEEIASEGVRLPGGYGQEGPLEPGYGAAEDSNSALTTVPASAPQGSHSPSAVETPKKKKKRSQEERENIDPYDPITWPWYTLFDLYLFAHQYSTRAFRMQVFLVIQSKAVTVNPRQYVAPTIKELLFAVNNLEPCSPLYRLLVNYWACMLSPRMSDSDQLDQIDDWATLPPRFLAACIMAMKRRFRAMNCEKCPAGEVGFTGVVDLVHRDEVGHSQVDCIPIRRRHSCYYHEHGEDKEEAKRCHLQWESRKHLLEKPSAEATEEEGELAGRSVGDETQVITET